MSPLTSDLSLQVKQIKVLYRAVENENRFSDRLNVSVGYVLSIAD